MAWSVTFFRRARDNGQQQTRGKSALMRAGTTV